MKTRQVSYFDLVTTGVGYLNRVMEVTMEEGMPFLTVKIAALRRRAGNVKKTYLTRLCPVRKRTNGRESWRTMSPMMRVSDGRSRLRASPGTSA